MRPFGEVGNLGGYTLHTVEKNERVKLQNFKINFIDSAYLNPDSKKGTNLIDTIFEYKKPIQNDTVTKLSRQESEQEFFNKLANSRKGTEEEQTPWFSMWKQAYLANHRFMIHELTQQPVGFIVMISVDDEDPIGTIA
jgi:putative heme degradation protein